MVKIIIGIIIKLKQYIKNAKYQIIKYLIIGISSTVLDIWLLISLKEIVSFRPTSAVAINQIFVIAYNFLLNKYWSFNTRQQPLRQFSRYIILVGLNYSAAIFLMYIFHDILSINYILVRISSIALLFIINFIFYKHWVYQEA